MKACGYNSGTIGMPSMPICIGFTQTARFTGNDPYRCGNRSPPRDGSHLTASPSASAGTATISKIRHAGKMSSRGLVYLRRC